MANGLLSSFKDHKNDDSDRKHNRDKHDSRKSSREIKKNSRSRSRSREKFEGEEGQVMAPISKHKKDKNNRLR